MMIFRLLFNGLKLFFILPLCMISKKAFKYFWNKYYTIDLEPNIFNLCVQWLEYNGKKLGIDYMTINVLIFCIIWPIITISSLILNIILITSYV